MKQLADIGLIGLAVMGENLVLNMESKGYTVAVFNRTVEKVDAFINGRAMGKNIIGTHSIEELVKSIKKPRKVMLLVKAGKAVDDFIENLFLTLKREILLLTEVILISLTQTEEPSMLKAKDCFILAQVFQEAKRAL